MIRCKEPWVDSLSNLSLGFLEFFPNPLFRTLVEAERLESVDRSQNCSACPLDAGGNVLVACNLSTNRPRAMQVENASVSRPIAGHNRR